jgi:hypothetical protein
MARNGGGIGRFAARNKQLSQPDAPPTVAARAGGPAAGKLPNNNADTTVTAATAMWEEPAPASDDAAAMEVERPATAINSFGYDGDDGGLPATSGSNIFSSLGQMFGEQNNDNAMDDDMDNGNVGNMFFSLYRQTPPTIEPTKEEATIKMEDKDYAAKKRPSRVAKKTVSYCDDTSDLELEFNKDGYERFKTKSFKKKANATNSDSNEFELGPEADTSDSKEFELGPEAYTMLSEIESEDEEMIGLKLKRRKNCNVQTHTHEYTGHPIEEDEEATKPSTAAKSSTATKPSAAIKSSIGVDERKLAAKPYTTGVAIELTDMEKRVKNKKIKAEVLQKMSQFKAELSVSNAFGPEHWKELLSQMENDGDYTNHLFFGQSKIC